MKAAILRRLPGSKISAGPRIVGFRNRIIHGYDSIDDATVWGVIEGRLPRLIEQASALLEKTGERV